MAEDLLLNKSNITYQILLWQTTFWGKRYARPLYTNTKWIKIKNDWHDWNSLSLFTCANEVWKIVIDSLILNDNYPYADYIFKICSNFNKNQVFPRK